MPLVCDGLVLTCMHANISWCHHCHCPASNLSLGMLHDPIAPVATCLQPTTASHALLLPMQVKNVAHPPKPKDVTSLTAMGCFVDYKTLAKGAYHLLE